MTRRCARPPSACAGSRAASAPLAAVDGLDFEVRRGELFGLVGPDGAGKTTTLRMLAGVLRPTAGDAEPGRVSVVRDTRGGEATRLAYMSQRFGLYADLTVRENLDFYADLYRVPRQERPARLERLFRFSNLEPFEDRLAGKLSGGMKQKLGLSCALIHQPEFLLLDEPTFGVDPISRRDLWLIVHEMVAQGVTAVVSTAYMDEAERFDRRGAPRSRARPGRGHAGGADAAPGGAGLGAAHGQPAQSAAGRGAGAGGARRGGLRRAVARDPRARGRPGRRASALSAALEAAGIPVLELAPVEASMEDVFIDFVLSGGAA